MENERAKIVGPICAVGKDLWSVWGHNVAYVEFFLKKQLIVRLIFL